MPLVKVDGKKIKFPDNMSPQEIEDALNEYGAPNPPKGGGFAATARGGRKIPAVTPRVGGAIGGGVAGSMIGGVPGGVIGGIIGGMAGEASTGKKEDESTDAFLTRTTFAGALSGIEELGGYGAYRVGGKILAPFAKSLTEEGKIAWATLEKYMPKKMGLHKPPLDPAEMTESWALDVLHNIASKSYVGGHTMANFRNIIRKQAVDSLIDDVATKFGAVNADPVQLGNLVSDVAQGEWKRYQKAIIDPLYNSIDKKLSPKIEKIPVTRSVETGLVDKAGNPITQEVFDHYDEIETSKVKISIRGIKDFLEPKYRRIKKLPPIEKDHAGDHLISGIMNMPNEVDFLTAVELRKRLIAASDRLSVENKKAPAIGLAKHLTGRVDDAISGALKTADPAAYHVWRQANKLYKYGHKQFNNRFLRTLIKQADPEKGIGQPEKVLKTVFQKGGISGIQKTKDAVGPETWNRLKGWYVQDLLMKSAGRDGSIDGFKFLNNMFGPSGMGKQALETIFTKEELRLLKDAATTIKVTQTRQASGAGGMMIQLFQASALTSLAVGAFRGPAVAIMVSPEVVARLFTFKPFVRWATSTAKLSPKTAVAASTTARLAGFADTVQNIVYKERREE